ncbi:MAG: allophanate hydrolase, partial [Halioglobus sp.]|nr:allophanate hydrolase [Halioglobus sp.]
PLWCVHPVAAGDAIELGFATRGCRAYLGVADGFTADAQFDSTATVVREALGGLNGNGQPLAAGDILPCARVTARQHLQLAPEQQPRYANQLTVRVIPGYQRRLFSRLEKRRFFGARYTVSERSDRMGYRLEGAPVACATEGIISEGICHGAIQVPPDGNPIVLLNDRQTIGGYPKIGAALSLDTARLAQLTAGATVHFAPVTRATATRALDLAARFTLNKPLRQY